MIISRCLLNYGSCYGFICLVRNHKLHEHVKIIQTGTCILNLSEIKLFQNISITSKKFLFKRKTKNNNIIKTISKKRKKATADNILVTKLQECQSEGTKSLRYMYVLKYPHKLSSQTKKWWNSRRKIRDNSDRQKKWNKYKSENQKVATYKKNFHTIKLTTSDIFRPHKIGKLFKEFTDGIISLVMFLKKFCLVLKNLDLWKNVNEMEFFF